MTRKRRKKVGKKRLKINQLHTIQATAAKTLASVIHNNLWTTWGQTVGRNRYARKLNHLHNILHTQPRFKPYGALNWPVAFYTIRRLCEARSPPETGGPYTADTNTDIAG